MSAAARPSSPDPHPSRGVRASDLVATQSPPPPALPVAAEDNKHPSPLLKLVFPYAVAWVFKGMNRTCGMAAVALHAVMCILWLVTFETDLEPEVWTSIFRVWVYLGVASIMLVTWWDCIYYCMNYNPPLPPQQPAETGAAVQLPPPPPEMDMC